jgi:hypothetical protein
MHYMHRVQDVNPYREVMHTCLQPSSPKERNRDEERLLSRYITIAPTFNTVYTCLLANSTILGQTAQMGKVVVNQT